MEFAVYILYSRNFDKTYVGFTFRDKILLMFKEARILIRREGLGFIRHSEPATKIPNTFEAVWDFFYK